MDVTTLLSSGVVAAIVAGGISWLTKAQENARDDGAARREVRASAVNLASQIMLLRQYGFAQPEILIANRIALADVLKDRTVLKALDDDEALALNDAVRDCEPLIWHVTQTYGEPGAQRTPADLFAAQDNLRSAAQPTYLHLRQFFESDENDAIIEMLDKRSGS